VRRSGQWAVVLLGVMAGHVVLLSLMALRSREPKPGPGDEPIDVALVTLPHAKPPTKSPPQRHAEPPKPPRPPALRAIAPYPSTTPVAAPGAVPGVADLLAAPFATADGRPRLKLELPACDPGGMYPPNSGHKPCPRAAQGPVFSPRDDGAYSGFAMEARRKAAMRDYRDHLGSPYPGLLCAIDHRCR